MKITEDPLINPSIRGFFTLLHAHDYIWRERGIDLNTRIKACDILYSKAAMLAMAIDKKFPDCESV